MDKKLLLIQAITLLFRESQLELNSFESGNIVRPIVETISLPEVSIGPIDNERDILVGLKKLCLDMCDYASIRKFELTELLQTIRYICRDDDALYTSFFEGVSTELDEEKLKDLCLSLRFTFKSHDKETKVQEIINSAARVIKFSREDIKDMTKFVAELCAKLEPFQSTSAEIDPAIIGTASSSEDGSMEKNFETSKELNDEKGIMKTGWQGVNRMLQGGLRRGETVVVSALQHNFKTGFALSIFKHMALYNKPYMIDSSKKPLLLHISFENSLALNLPFMYRNIYENKTGLQADLYGRTAKELSNYVREELRINGYETLFIHVNPSLWTYMDICNYIVWLETQGYEVHMCMIDYLNMIPKTGCDNTGPTGSSIRDLFRRLRKFCASKKIILFTPHQMSVDAKVLIRNGIEDTLVKEVANKGYYDGCKTIDQEVDLEIYFHIVKAQDGRSYLTIQRGKHRVIKQTASEHLYCVLPFEDIGDIKDDINGIDTTRRKPGHGPINSKAEVPFWEFENEPSAKTTT